MRSRLHLERDLLRVPLSGPVGTYESETLWYWQQLNHLASEPTRIPIDLSRLDRESESVFSLKLQFRGWSDSANASGASIPDHVVEISLNGTMIGRGSWDGRDTHLIEMTRVSPELVRPDHNALEIRVPLRRQGNDAETVIDVVYLDWIEAIFPRDTRLGDKQERLQLPADGNTGWLSLVTTLHENAGPAGEFVDVFSDSGFHAAIRRQDGAMDEALRAGVFEAPIPPGAHSLWVVPDGGFKRAPVIELDRPSRLTESTDQSDYFIIVHPSLVEAAEPLARFHNRHGTSTEIVNVQDIYDEFNFGIKHPRAIRDFLAHARKTRPAPAPSHVLLVGDASWYVKEHAEATPERIRYNQRDLIPTWQLRSRDGPAASDNPYVMLDGDDFLPDMAIGRFPASSPAEARSMVNKTVSYMENPAPGPWRARVALASDSTRNLSARNAQLVKRARNQGLNALEFLPDAADDGELQQLRLRSSIDEGMLVMHFFGHGGRFMWQMAPSRGTAGNLFDMQDLDQLAPSTRLPIVLSMSCATGPFDHPEADSLAEKFLRMQDRGAVAVLAASARNSPSLNFTNLLFDGILNAPTLGEAVQIAKNARMHPDSAMFYNLFGDPALVPARPQRIVPLEITGRSPLEVEVLVPFEEFDGFAEVQWLHQANEPVVQRLEVDGGPLVLRAPRQSDSMGFQRVAIYLWNREGDQDASGTIGLDEEVSE
ncbi:MAG: C25 family cysteine peptidase [Wenzhouxiangellaceae bacterium]